MSVGSIARQRLETSEIEQFGQDQADANSASHPDRVTLFLVSRQPQEELSPWSRSLAKRLFDCFCVLLALPLLLPMLLGIAIAVRLTSSGPVLFLQKRVGCHGRAFTILKFRTMLHDVDMHHHAVTTADNQPFTSIGPFLRRWKFDELPQIFNVLLGHMSLVGPRPKMPEHVKVDLCCRPGITGAATIAFAREETILERVPKHSLDAYYHKVILPTKRKMDAEYMARATFLSDLRLIVNSVLRRWEPTASDLLLEETLESASKAHESRPQGVEPIAVHSAKGAAGRKIASVHSL